MEARKFTRSDQFTLEKGYYWIRRTEPDGPSEWEIAEFYGQCWYVIGNSHGTNPTHGRDASNAWLIGDKIELDTGVIITLK